MPWEEWGHDVLLVGWAQKVVREAASVELSDALGVVTCRPADSSDLRTYERVVVC